MLVPSGYNPQKRLEVVIEALALLGEPRPSVAIVGPVDRTDYRDHLMSLAADLGVSGAIHFGEDVPGIRGALREASLVILPSFSEGFPIVGQEAIAEGARVAWSRIGAHVELFGDVGAPFWTAAELAVVMVGDHAEASVAARQPWLCGYQREVKTLRADYWDELERFVEYGRH
jgi:glycosyltransferase involved in cell wall biosynthesis